MPDTDASIVAARRPVRTYLRAGREHYADTGRPVNERLGSHVVLWVVEDPEAWAAAVEAAADAEYGQWPPSMAGTAEFRRAQRYQDAAHIRAAGPCTTWRAHEHSAERADAHVAGLRRAHPNPGVRYEVAEIVSAGACPDCQQPTIKAAGEWRHHLGGYPALCSPRPHDDGHDEAKRVDGEWEIDVGRGHMICGYCDQTESWPAAVLGYVELTGDHLLGVEIATDELVVLAEATTLRGQTTFLAHYCDKIPDDLRAKYTPEGSVA